MNATKIGPRFKTFEELEKAVEVQVPFPKIYMKEFNETVSGIVGIKELLPSGIIEVEFLMGNDLTLFSRKHFKLSNFKSVEPASKRSLGIILKSKGFFKEKLEHISSMLDKVEDVFAKM